MLRLTFANLCMVVALAASAVAHAQTPTAAQRDALRANCAGDFRANCAGVSPGGMGALLCLEQNEAKLSPGCKSAVDAVKGPQSTPAAKPSSTDSSAAAPPAKTAAAPQTTPAPAAAPEAAPVSFRQEVRIGARSCFGDFTRFCPSLPMGHGNMVRCLKEHAANLSPDCHDAMEAVGNRLR